MTESAEVTSDLYWISTLVAVIVAAGIGLLLKKRLPENRFQKLPWWIAGVSALFWGGLWATVLSNPWFWETCYQFVFSPEMRWGMPVIMFFYKGIVGLLIWWLAGRLPGNRFLGFALLGGLESLPGHLWAIYGGGIFNTPLLQWVSPTAVLVFGVVEFIIYWSAILTIAALQQQMWERWKHLTENNHDPILNQIA